MKGNEALAEAAIQAGCMHYFGYPITPQTEISAYMSKKLPKLGGTFLQAESEIAAINMVLGASCTGVRTMTSSSSPGISLKAEALSYIAGSDLPCVIVNVQRAGPGLGGIQPAQSDYNQATKALGHGDFKFLIFAPNSVQEMVDLVFTAFEISEKYRVPAMILSDGLIGQMMEPVEFPEAPNIEVKEKSWALTGHKNIRKNNIITSLSLQAQKLEDKIKERYERYEKIIQNEVLYEDYNTHDAELVIIAYGATSRICHTAVDNARKEGYKVGLLRPITLWPFPKEAIKNTAEKVQNILVVEMSMGQMVDDVKLCVNGLVPVHFYGRTGGVVPLPEEVLNQIKSIMGGKV